MHWIDATTVEQRLGYDECMAAMRAALIRFSRGEAVQPLRTALRLPDDRGALYVMPAYGTRPESLAVKLISVFEGNTELGRPTHNGVIVALDPRTGEVRALIDAAPVTAIRTAAVSAVATDALAVSDAAILALIGSGVQARSHLEAITRVRPIERVRVWSRTVRHAHAFADAHRHAGPRVEVAADVRTAVRDAAIICTVTAAHEPVLHRDWVAPGAHINAVGASMPHAREIDGALIAACRIYVDSVEAAGAEAGDLLIARTEGLIGDDSIVGEIGALLDGRAPGRASTGDITLFKSLGLAIEDAAAAALILAQDRDGAAGI